MNTTGYTGSSGRFCRSLIASITRSVIVVTACSDTPGITMRPIKLIDGSVEVNEVFFEDVRVPADQLAGEENQGWTYAKFLLGNERTGIAGVGRTKVRLAEVKECATDTGMLDDPLFAARLAEAENDLLALELTQVRVASGSADGKPNPVSSVLKLRNSVLQQLTTELLVEVASPDALPLEAGDEITAVGAGQRAALPQLPQDVDLRWQQRSSAHHHCVDHSRLVRQECEIEPWTLS